MSETSPSFFRDLATVIRASGRDGQRLLVLTAINNVVTALLDAIGVGAIIPFVAVVSMPDLFQRYAWLASWVPQPLQEHRAWLVFAGAGVFALIYCLRAAVTLFGAYLQASMQGTLTLRLSDQLFGNYLQRSYAYHLEKGPSFFAARLDGGIYQTRTAIMAVQQFGVELLTATLILALVVAVNPFAALISVLGMGIPSVLIYRWLRQRTKRLGKREHDTWEQATRALYTGINAIKDIKVFGNERYFHQKYRTHQESSRDISTESSIYSNAPRVMIELSAVLAILALCVVLTWQGRLGELMLVMGLYAAAAFRLMPCANRLLMALTQLRLARHGMELVAADIRLLPEVPSVVFSPEYLSAEQQPRFELLSIDQVSFRYRSDLPAVLDSVSVHVQVGESIGFVGSSGAGKSTLVDIVLGLLKPSSGSVFVNGMSIETHMRSWQQRIGYVPQAIYLIDDSIRHNVAFGMADEHISDIQVWLALEAACLKDFVQSLPDGLDTRVGERGVKLSGGQRQRVGIARALYHEPDILILDEATSALDNATEAEFMQAVEALHGKKTILMVAHRLSTVERCDRIVVMQQGRIVDIGSYSSLMSDSLLFQQIAGLSTANFGVDLA